MTKGLFRPLTLRYALHVGLMVLMVTMLFASYWGTVVSATASLRQHARLDALNDAEHMARTAQRDLQERRTNVAADLSIAATEPRTRTLALVDPNGTVELAHRLASQNRPAEEVLPDFSMQRFSRVVQGRTADIEESADGQEISVMLPYFLGGNEQSLRTTKRGVVYLVYDLSHELEMVKWDAQRQLWPQLLAALFLAMGVSWLLRSRVTQPLANLESASLKLSLTNELPGPVAVKGPREVIQLANSFNDMIERIQSAQHDLHNSQARMAGIVDSAMDAIITMDYQQRITMANRAALRMFGYTEEQLLGQSIEMLIPERFRHMHGGHVEAFAQSGMTSRGMGIKKPIYGRRNSGEEFPADASISRLVLDGQLHLTVVLHDITERQRAEAEVIALNNNLEAQVQQRTQRLLETTEALAQQQRSLQAANQEQQTIFDTVTMGIALMKNRRILRCNRKLEALLGYESGGLVGKPTRVWYVDDAAHIAGGQPVIERLTRGEIDTRELELVRKDGSRFWAKLTAAQYEDAGGEIALLCIIEDLTLQREAAQALVQAKEKAEDASKAKSAFLANMSHEIRTPMNAIIGMSYLALKTELSPRQRDYIKKIQSSSQHLLGIINDILDYSKIEAGKLDVEHIEFELDKVLHTVANLISDKASSKNLELVLDVASDVPLALVGDPLRLGQILINYANNAVKFTAKGEIDIQVRVREQTDTDVLLYCAVKDTGIGLTDSQISRLFQSFEQADSSTTREFGGTGLGLAICRQLANLMQGEVGVDSEFGKGSTFWFTARMTRSAAAARPQVLRSELYGKRVLVVDDNDSARILLADMLGSLNLVPHSVDSGAAALEAVYLADVESRPFEIVFLDWQMPQMSGIELATRIHALPLATRPRIVLVTGYGREEVLKGAEEAGIQNVLVKPVNSSMLFDCVVRELGEPDGTLGEAAPVLHGAEEGLASIPGARILLVEDNELNQEVAGELLRHAGVTVDVAENGKVAVAKVQATAYDLVLMDMQMPVMDGLTATRTIRQLPGFSALPIVAMTANATRDDREACLSAGMNDHVAKPIEPSDLFDCLLKWIKPRANVNPSKAPEQRNTVSEPVDLPVVSGLDTVMGLRRVLGDHTLYLSLLRRFVSGQHSAIDAIDRAIKANDLDTARLLTHTLKGLAGTICIGAIQKAAAHLELAIQQNNPTNMALDLSALAEVMTPFLLALESALAELDGRKKQADAPAVDASELTALGQQLCGLLAQDDMEAGDLFAAHEAVWQAALGDGYGDVAQAIRAFDYALALQSLKDALIARGIKPQANPA